MNTLLNKALIKDHNSVLQIYIFGPQRYSDILQLQQYLAEQRKKNEIVDTVIITEHFPVITLGARQSKNKLHIDRQLLQQKQIDVVDIRRGGGTTAHNPGQIVFYPILNLQKSGLGINKYVRKLEEIGAELLRELAVESSIRKGMPGLWLNEKKIASIGVRVSRFITTHGMAINIQNDLSIFDLITPCGLEGVEMTSVLKETGRKHSMQQIKKNLAQLLKRHLT